MQKQTNEEVQNKVNMNRTKERMNMSALKKVVNNLFVFLGLPTIPLIYTSRCIVNLPDSFRSGSNKAVIVSLGIQDGVSK
jgi:hypothetical protein